MNLSGLIYDDSRHYLDHLAPFCALLNVPLIICEPALAELARSFYPDLEVIETSLWGLKLPSHTISCDPEAFLKAAFPGQKTNLLWLPHGNSDKGFHGPFFEGTGPNAFVYGQKMVDFMHAKSVHPKIFRIGNFRLHYFLKHREFYSKKIVLPSTKTILYAPTWDDLENSCSFWKAFPHLAAQLPQDFHLLVKLHPNTLRKFEVELEILFSRYASYKNITICPEIPPIYPLLSASSMYIGDMSSIGYDFLHFDRPMYFLNANPTLPLHRCGPAIDPQAPIFSETALFSSIRKATYAYTFDPVPNFKELLDVLCRL